MRKGFAYAAMAGIVLLLAGMDVVLVATSGAARTRTAEAEFRRLAGGLAEWKGFGTSLDLVWRGLSPTVSGSVTLEGVTARPLGPKLPPVQAGRATISLRDGAPERIVLEDVQGELSDALFEELASREPAKPFRELFPDPSKIPALAIRRAAVTTRLSAIFEGGRPQTVAVKELSVTPMGGYRVHVAGSFESPLAGAWTVRGEIDLDTNARRLALECSGLRIAPALREPLVDGFKAIYDKYLPGGLCDLRVAIDQAPGEAPDVTVTLLARDMTLTYKNFPYPVERVRGEIEFRARGFEIKRMTGHRGSATIRFDGAAGGYAAESEFAFRIEIDDMPVDGALRDALDPDARRVFDLFSPTGKVSARGRAVKEFGRDKKERIPLNMTMSGVTMSYKEFPYEFRNLTGNFTLDGNTVSINRLQARDGETAVDVKGRIGNITADADVDLQIDAERLPLDGRLKAAIGDEARKTWDLFSPSGVIDLRWRLRKESGKELVHEARARARGISVTYKEVPLPVTGVEGEIEMLPGKFLFRHLTGKCKGGEVEVHGSVTDLVTSLHVDGTGIPLDEEVKTALPEAVRDFLRSIKLSGVVSFNSGLTFKKDGRRQVDLLCRLANGVIDTEPKFEDLDGTVTMTGYFDREPMIMGFMNFSRGAVAGKRIADVAASFNAVGSKINFLNIKASAYGGVLAGKSFSVDTRTKDFYGELFTLDRMELQEFARDTQGYAGKTLAGKISVEVKDLKGNSDDASKITGRGRLVIKEAELWDVPVFLNLVALNPGALFTERKQFDAGAVEFTIRDRKFDIERLAFTSETVSVAGEGRINFDGEISLRLKPKAGPLLGVDFFLFRAGGELLNLLLGGALTVKVGGTFEKPEIK